MRLLLGTALVALLVVPALRADEKDPRDAPIVKKVRKKLKTIKVSVDYEESTVKDVIADLKDKSGLGISILPGSGVSANQPISFKADNKPLADVLDQMFKKADLGYVIGRHRHGERYIGWILLEKGPFRGDDDADKADAAPPEKKTKKADKTTKAKPPDEPMDDNSKAEQRAEVKYRFAKELADDGKIDKAKERLQEVIQKWPNTKAAGLAKTLLEKLKQ